MLWYLRTLYICKLGSTKMTMPMFHVIKHKEHIVYYRVKIPRLCKIHPFWVDRSGAPAGARYGRLWSSGGGSRPGPARRP